MFLASIIFRVPCRRQVGTLLNRRILFHLLAGVCAAGITIGVRQALPMTTAWTIMRDGVLVLAVYVGILILVHELTSDDYRRVGRWFNPLGVLRYFNSEIRK